MASSSLCFASALLACLVLFISSSHVAADSSVGRFSRPCDEVYVVGEGETLHSISDRCGDPFILEQNPHIQDSDDVFPGLVIEITPRNKFARKFLNRG